MDFPWYEPKTNKSVKAANPTWRDDMHRRDIQLRAALLYRLDRPLKDATAAIKRYVQWEFEGLVSPKIQGEIGEIVAAVYKRQKPAGG